MKYITKILLILLIINACLFLSCRKKCFKNFYNYNAPLIQEIEVVLSSANNQISSGDNFVEIYVDSVSYYSKYSEPKVNFKLNSVLIFQQSIEKNRRRYINGFEFNLTEDAQDYIFIINVCSYKVLRNKKSRVPFERKYILTNKLRNKPIKTTVNYDY
ncbi:MAG: hypothetical protein HYX39_11675 [Bacteroidetes bacterium]|nr:hypothetical protein [Bacteroidota bacterium]